MVFSLRTLSWMGACVAVNLTACVASTDEMNAAETTDTPGDADLGSTAQAVSASVCGAGYKLVGVTPLKSQGPQYPLPGGEIEVFYNAAKGENCVILQSLGAWYGLKKHMSVFGCVLNSARTDCVTAVTSDVGEFKYYAGPIYFHAPHRCIDVEGLIDDPKYPSNLKNAYANYVNGYCD